MPETDKQRIQAALSLYSKFFLAVYDWAALGFNCRYIWKCPSYYMLNLYNKYVSSRHLDIGVGTGYFLDRCTFPVPDPSIALMDMNRNSLAAAGRRLARYNPRVYIGNALEKFRLNGRKYDSIGMMNLLHCLPGDMSSKGVVFDNADWVLNTGGTVFGSTILYKGVKRNRLTTRILQMDNKKGFMTNLEDSAEVLRDNLKEKFPESAVEIVGCMALFWARK